MTAHSIKLIVGELLAHFPDLGFYCRVRGFIFSIQTLAIHAADYGAQALAGIFSNQPETETERYMSIALHDTICEHCR